MEDSVFFDVVDIVGQYVQLTEQDDAHFYGRCPFCLSKRKTLIVRRDIQHWHCFSCGADGDRYDFVAQAEGISRAEAIILVAHHSIAGGTFPQADATKAKLLSSSHEEVGDNGSPTSLDEQEQSVSVAPQDSAVPTPPSKGTEEGTEGGGKSLLSILLEFRNIASYEGSAIFDESSEIMASDEEYPLSADLVGLGEAFLPVLLTAPKVFQSSGAAVPSTLSFSAEHGALLFHRFGNPESPKLFAIRLGNPADLPVARRGAISVTEGLN